MPANSRWDLIRGLKGWNHLLITASRNVQKFYHPPNEHKSKFIYKPSFLDYFTVKRWKHSLSSFETSPKIYRRNILEDLNLQRNFGSGIIKVPKLQVCRFTLCQVFRLGSKGCDTMRICKWIPNFGAEYPVSVFRVMWFLPWRCRQYVFPWSLQPSTVLWGLHLQRQYS